MNKTFIIGTANLSSTLQKRIVNSKIYSAKKFLKNIDSINKRKKNIIINSFYSSTKLKTITSYEIFVKKTLSEIAKILDLLNCNNVDKIIYTSSASVYGLNDKITNLEDENNRYIYSAFKLSAELLIKNFCKKKKINFIICRVFNIYGGKDKFSLIHKLKKIANNNKKIIIYNSGKSIRDFIYIDNVVTIYSLILKKKITSGLYDVGTGKGIKIIDLIRELNLKKVNLVYKKLPTSEISTSVANNKNLFRQIKKIKFNKIKIFLNSRKING